MNSTPTSNRFQIGIFGKSNVGKSSLINAITNQNISIVSDKKGTTTDPVFKAMEIPLIGACTIIDTPGFDDIEEQIGKIRVEKSFEVLDYVDAAILVLEKTTNLNTIETDFLKKVKIKKIPLIVLINRFNNNSNEPCDEILKNCNLIEVNAKEKQNIKNLIDLISNKFSQQKEKENFLVADLIEKNDVIVLVIAIDESYPKARLILPQQQLIYEILNKGGICKICKNTEYEELLKKLKKPPKLIVTDSQIFSEILKKTPKDFLITSFSILLARKNKVLKPSIEGVKILEQIKESDRILVCESCTHNKKKCDVGSVKIPKWIEQKTKKKLDFNFLTGDSDFKQIFKNYRLVVHCGGCMTTPKKIQNRFNLCEKNNIPITNYGVLIAYLNNSLKRTTMFLSKLKNS